MSTTFDKVADIIAETCDIPRDTITPDSHAIDDLKIDSLDFLDIAFAIDKAFGIKLPLEQWTQKINDGQATTEQYFVLKNLCARIDELIAAKSAPEIAPDDFVRVAQRVSHPSRAPMRLEYFQMLDRFVEVKADERWIRTESKVPMESPVFEGHFPGYPLMPGVLLIENMAQTCGWLVSAITGFTGLPVLAGVKEREDARRGFSRHGAFDRRQDRA